MSRRVSKNGQRKLFWNYFHLFKSVFIFLLVVAPSVYGETPIVLTPPPSKDLGPTADGIVGLVVNQTITTNGYEFYRKFSLLWSDKPESREYSLDVKERLNERFGNRIEIYLGQKLVYTSALPRKFDLLQAFCEQAVEQSQKNIGNALFQPLDVNDISGDVM